MADFQLDLSTHLDALKEEKIIKLEDLEDIMDKSKDIDEEVQRLSHSKEKLSNKDVHLLITEKLSSFGEEMEKRFTTFE